MFAVGSDYDRHLIHALLVPQVAPEVLAQSITGDALHLRSLDAALRRAKCLLGFVAVHLQTDQEWSVEWQETLGFHLSAACTMIAGALDGMAILASMRSDNLTNLGTITFSNMAFSSLYAAREQTTLLELRSPRLPPQHSKTTHNSQDVYVDFFSVTNFWKHYMPLPPLPKFFEKERVFDFQLEFGGIGVTIKKLTVTACACGTGTTNEHSGPVLHDLLIPAYDCACNILHSLAAERGAIVQCLHFQER